ncbi:Surface lipoprotein [hydrothermal vent metagenome]|uniref:Surface lipoprotein n=1 Tax=hydrothermal vent metagenome TaxID=652676 RepID=A0A3B1DT54_9ZZZZ
MFGSGCATKNIVEYPDSSQLENSEVIVSGKSDDTQQLDFLDDFKEEDNVQSNPFEGYNIFMTNFNDGLYFYAVNPVAHGYSNVIHKSIRKSISNLFHNMLYPARVVNNILQGKMLNAAEETSRFIINTTVGVFGLFDPAIKYLKLNPHNEDFGQTLGYWGVSSGYHVVLPFLGPSNLRDIFGMYSDSMFNPIEYYGKRVYNLSESYDYSLTVEAYKKLNYTSLHLGEYEELTKDAVQLYPYLKDIYEQYRNKLIKE